MSSTRPPDDAGADRSRTYLLVFIVEAAVIAALWWFGRFFSGT